MEEKNVDLAEKTIEPNTGEKTTEPETGNITTKPNTGHKTTGPDACDEIIESNTGDKTSDSVIEDKASRKTDPDQLLDDRTFTKNNAELLKCIEPILASYKNTAPNITINNISGDSVSGSAQKFDFGKDNIFESDVTIGSNSNSPDEIRTTNSNATIDLSNSKAIYEYLKANQQSSYCSLLIVLSIFENCQFDLVCEEAKILYLILSEEQREIVNDKDEIKIIYREQFEISRQEAIEKFAVTFYQDNLITFGGKILTSFIGFSSSEHSGNILKCVFEEFISLRDKITAYLTKLICSEKIILYAAAINVIKKTCYINPEYFITGIVVRLLQNKSIPSDIAIAEILCSIAEHSKSTYNADKYLGFISEGNKDIHYYIITLLMCRTLSFKRDKIGKLINPILWELIKQPIIESLYNNLDLELHEKKDFINNIDVFFNIGNRYAEYYIALVTELYNIMISFKKTDTRRYFVQCTTLLFISEDYKASCLNPEKSDKFKDLIFIRLVLRDSETAKKIVFLWSELLKNKDISPFVKQFLENYLTDRDNKNTTENEYQKIEAFFLKLSTIESVKNTLLFFLNNLSTRPKNKLQIARRIYLKIGGN